MSTNFSLSLHYTTNPSATVDPVSAGNLTIVSDRGRGVSGPLVPLSLLVCFLINYYLVVWLW